MYSPQCDYECITLQHSELKRCFSISKVRYPNPALSSYSDCIIGAMPRRDAISELPNILYRLGTTQYGYTLDCHPALILSAGRGKIFCRNVQRASEMLQGVLCVSICLLKCDVYVRRIGPSWSTLGTAPPCR